MAEIDATPEEHKKLKGFLENSMATLERVDGDGNAGGSDDDAETIEEES